MTTRLPQLRERIAAPLFIDTHEHLVEETTRLKAPGNPRFPCNDFAPLFIGYPSNDLLSSGMPSAEIARLFRPELEPGEKWRILERYWTRCRHTGYMQAIAITADRLFGEPVMNAGAAERITERMRAYTKRGFYRPIFNFAGVETSHVNSLETMPFCESDDPDILQQDLSLVPLSTGVDLELMGRLSGLPTESLADWHQVLDWTFEKYGPLAVAVKIQAAYQRRLNYEAVNAETAAPLYSRLQAGAELTAPERKALEDHLMRECFRRADQYGLPVKLHCGYYVGNSRMPLERVRQNASDLCPLLVDFPRVNFVLMHIGYPYQDEYIALAKHYPNVWVDLCLAWIINPAASVRFTREFLMSAPANKLLTFGADYSTIEPMVGQAAMARRGLEQALTELVGEGWLDAEGALALVEPLMRDNANALFPDRRGSVIAVPPAS